MPQMKDNNLYDTRAGDQGGLCFPDFLYVLIDCAVLREIYKLQA